MEFSQLSSSIVNWAPLQSFKNPPCCEWCPRIFQPNLKSNEHSQLHTNNSLTPNTLEKMQRKDEKFNLNTNIAEIHSVHLTLNCGSHSFWPFFAYVFLNSSHTLCILYSLVLCELSLWIMDVMRGNISDLTRRRIHPSSGWSRVGVLCRWIFTFCNLSIKKNAKTWHEYWLSGGQPTLGNNQGGVGECFLGARSDQEMFRS